MTARYPRVRVSQLRKRPTALRYCSSIAPNTSTQIRERDRQIFEMYRSESLTQAQIGEHFGLSQSRTSAIICRELRARGEQS